MRCRRLDAPLGRALGALPLDRTLREARDAFERVYFEYHIGREGGNMSRVAERVGLERTHLYRKLKQLGVKLAAQGIGHVPRTAVAGGYNRRSSARAGAAQLFTL